MRTLRDGQLRRVTRAATAHSLLALPLGTAPVRGQRRGASSAASGRAPSSPSHAALLASLPSLIQGYVVPSYARVRSTAVAAQSLAPGGQQPQPPAVSFSQAPITPAPAKGAPDAAVRWSCAYCGHSNPSTANACGICAARRGGRFRGHWLCGCGHTNVRQDLACSSCEAPFSGTREWVCSDPSCRTENVRLAVHCRGCRAPQQPSRTCRRCGATVSVFAPACACGRAGPSPADREGARLSPCPHCGARCLPSAPSCHVCGGSQVAAQVAAGSATCDGAAGVASAAPEAQPAATESEGVAPFAATERRAGPIPTATVVNVNGAAAAAIVDVWPAAKDPAKLACASSDHVPAPATNPAEPPQPANNTAADVGNSRVPPTAAAASLAGAGAPPPAEKENSEDSAAAPLFGLAGQGNAAKEGAAPSPTCAHSSSSAVRAAGSEAVDSDRARGGESRHAWTCKSCGSRQLVLREACAACNTPRTRPLFKNRVDGHWACRAPCGTFNMLSDEKCRSCGGERTALLSNCPHCNRRDVPFRGECPGCGKTAVPCVMCKCCGRQTPACAEGTCIHCQGRYTPTTAKHVCWQCGTEGTDAVCSYCGKRNEATQWACDPPCGRGNVGSRTECLLCGKTRRRDALVFPSWWRCPSCEATNPSLRGNCRRCAGPRSFPPDVRVTCPTCRQPSQWGPSQQCSVCGTTLLGGAGMELASLGKPTSAVDDDAVLKALLDDAPEPPAPQRGKGVGRSAHDPSPILRSASEEGRDAPRRQRASSAEPPARARQREGAVQQDAVSAGPKQAPTPSDAKPRRNAPSWSASSSQPPPPREGRSPPRKKGGALRSAPAKAKGLACGLCGHPSAKGVSECLKCGMPID